MARRYKPRSFKKRTRSSRYRAQRSARSAYVNTARRRYARTARRMGPYRNFMTSRVAYTTLHYRDTFTLDPRVETFGAEGTNLWRFCANSLYDTDGSGIGHQPMFHDNFSALYGKYQVMKAAITIVVVNHAVNTMNTSSTYLPSYSYRLMIHQDSANSPGNLAAGMDTLLEENPPGLKWRNVAPSLNGRLPKLSNFTVPHKLTNKAKHDDSLSAPTNNTPDQKVWFYVGITSADGLTDPPVCRLQVHIKYWVQYSERKFTQDQN